MPSAALYGLTPLPCPAGLYPLILSRLLHPALPSSFFSCQDPHGSQSHVGLVPSSDSPAGSSTAPTGQSSMQPALGPHPSLSTVYSSSFSLLGSLQGAALLPPPCICFSPEPSLSRWPILRPSATSNISFSFSTPAPAGTLP